MISAVAFYFNDDILFSRVAAIILIASIPISYSLLSDNLDPINLIRKVLIFHVIVFYTQFFLYFGLGIDFDPVALLSDATQSGWGGTLNHDVLGKFRRLGGMYNEPGTYATFIAPLVALFSSSKVSLYNKRKSDTAILFLSITSLVLTFSIFAWVFCIIIIGSIFVTSIKRFLLFIPLVPLASWLALPYVTYRFYDKAGSGIDSGVNFRQEIWDNIQLFMVESIPNLLWGYGFFNDKAPFRYFGAINDVGLLPYSLLYGGLSGTFLIIFLAVNSGWRLGLSGVAVYGILLSSKVSIFAPMLWLTLALSLHVSVIYGGKNHISN